MEQKIKWGYNPNIDMSKVTVKRTGEIDATEYMRNKIIEMIKKEENSLHLYDQKK